MNMTTLLTFTVELTTREFDLVTKGLCRTLIEGERHQNPKSKQPKKFCNDVEEALLLAELLMDGRIRETESQAARAKHKKGSAVSCLKETG